MSEEDRILYTALSKPFASALGVRSRWGDRSRYLPAGSVTRRFSKFGGGGKVITEERDVVRANEWFSEAEGELVEEVIGLGRYGKTLTVLSVKE